MSARSVPSKTRTDALEHAVEIESVVKIFGSGATAFTALDDVSISIRNNEFFTLLGPSGCGKTTLLRLIAGFEYPTQGNIKLNGEDIARLPPFKRPVNTVFQSYALFPHMSVAGNIAFGLEMLGRPRDEIEARVTEVLALVRMSELRDRATSEISGGQQQRVALARALAPSPRVLLLDEPLSALDYKLRKEMQIELKRMQTETGITFVFVTHDQDEALTMSDRIAVMSAGKVLQTGSPHDIYERPSCRFVASFIGESNFIPAKITAIDSSLGLATTVLEDSTTIVADCSGKIGAWEDCVLIVRPEQLTLRHFNQNDAQSQIPRGVLKNIVYSGTDTHFHVTLNVQTAVIIRQQNIHRRAGQVDDDFNVGDTVLVDFPPGAARVLEDTDSASTATGQNKSELTILKQPALNQDDSGSVA